MRHSKMKFDKKMLWIGGGVLAGVLLAAVYAMWSLATWNAYETSTAAWRTSMKKDTDTAFALPMAFEADRTKKLAAFDGLVERVRGDKDSVCTVNGLLAWQGVAPALAKRHAACIKATGAVGEFADKLAAMSAYEKAGKALGDGFAPLLKASALSEKTWSPKVQAWQQHLATLKAQKVTDDFSVVQKAAIEKEQAVVDAWKALQSAHGAKNEAKFVDARNKLNDAYGDLSHIGTVSLAQFKRITKELQQAYDTAF